MALIVRRRPQLPASPWPAWALLALIAALGATTESRADLDALLGLGVSGTSSQIVKAVDTDAAGNLYLAGEFRGPFQIGDGPEIPHTSGSGTEVFLSKLDPDGNHLWTAVGTGTEVEKVLDIDVLPTGEVAIVGQTWSPLFGFGQADVPTSGYQDAYVSLFSPDGTNEWTRVWGDDDVELASSVAFDRSNENHIIVAGEFADSISFGDGVRIAAGQRDFFLVDLEFDGDLSAAATYGSPSSQVNSRIAVDASGRIAFAGWFDSTVDLGNGDLVAVGGADICLAVFPSVGSGANWSASYGGPESDAVFSVGANDAGIFLCGAFQDEVDFGTGPLTAFDSFDGFVAAFKWSGTPVWSHRMGGSGIDLAIDLDLDDSIIALTGSFELDAEFGPFTVTAAESDGFVTTLQYDGAWEDFLRLRTLAEGMPSQVVLDGSPIVVGEYREQVSAGSIDLFSPEGLGAEGFLFVLEEAATDVPEWGHSEAAPFTAVARPNPFRGETTLELSSSDPGPLTTVRPAEGRPQATVHDVAGRLLRRLPLAARDGGAVFRWDGTDEGGRRLPSGPYFVRISTADGETTVPVTLQR